VSAENVKPGEYVIGITNQKLTSEELLGYRLDDKECSFSVVEKAIEGDVNGDGQVDIADVTALQNYLLGRVQTTFNKENADVNSDGDITIADVKALVNTILGKPN
jgi:hypothetical protein